MLSTRFVRTWREKHDAKGQPIWLRRSRFVAREFAWLEPERESLFSPASGNIISRIVPTVYLEMRETQNFDVVLASLDVMDAFLTVEQERPTLVHTVDAAGNSQTYALGKVLPGQRDGSLLWYKAITRFLKDKLDLEEHAPYPCVLKSKEHSCIVMIHVDDLVVAGRRSFILGKFSDELRKFYDIAVQCIERPGDEITFLKRLHVLHPDGRLTLQTHQKHIMKLCSLLGMNIKTQNMKTPAHSDVDREDTTADLTGDASTVFRTCVGILMYPGNDLPHCQYVIRHLSTYSSKPTVKSMVVLRHLVAYLACHGEISISLKWTGRCSGICHGYPDVCESENVLEIFTDSDWASDRNTRRSVSSCVMCIGSCLLFSASRTQKVVSLSSAEAEVYACSSGASDGILLSRLLSWLTGRKTWMFICTDSSGAKGILQRQGVGRLRHRSCRVLRLQNLIASGGIVLRSVSGHTNPADIGTKRLSVGRMKSLMSILGSFNGSDDPGKVFSKRQSIRSLLCGLSLLQLQGCESDIVSDNWSLIVWTFMIGLLMLMPLIIATLTGDSNTPDDDEPMPSAPCGDPASTELSLGSEDPGIFAAPSNDAPPLTAAAASSSSSHRDGSGMPHFSLPAALPFSNEAWSPDAMLTWMYDRCLRRLGGCGDNA